jgi:hypothetical protein
MLKTTTSIINASQIAGVLPVLNGGTGVTTSTGTGSTVLSAAPTLSGNVTLSTGNLIVANGQGIDFSATPGTGTSELLADYEEGTWTGILTDGANNATMGNSTFYYTKVGRLVTLNGYIYTTALGSVTGNISISGLPYTASNAANNYASNTPGFTDGLNIASGQSIGFVTVPNATAIRIYINDSADGHTWMQASEWSDNGEAMFSLTYMTN